MAGVLLERAGPVAMLRIDNPPLNVLARGIPRALVDRLAQANADPGVGAIVLMGAGTGSMAGADIRDFSRPRVPDEPSLRDAIAAFDVSPKPVIAALAGQVLGGGLELAMACRARIASATCRLGQPEIKLGFPPGAGGTQRLPRLVGADAALKLLLGGQPIAAAKALELGLVDAVVAETELVFHAMALAGDFGTVSANHTRTSERTIRVSDPSLFAKARAAIATSRGDRRAALATIDCVEAAVTLPFEAGLARELELSSACKASLESIALRHVFFAERAARKVTGIGADTQRQPIASAAVIGAGTMGGGIAMCFADAGIPVQLLDADPAALQRGLATIRRNYEASAAKGRLAPEESAARLARITTISSYEQIGGADIVIEAVFEDFRVKREVFAKLDGAAKPDAILASNTSYLDVDALAACVPSRLGKVLGTHFFSPANVMRLLEVVRTKSATPETLASVLALARRLNKLPVVSCVCHGFIGNRMLEGYLREAEFVLEEGATPLEVDAVITEFGFPMGPFAMVDLAGLDIGWRKRRAFAAVRDPAKRYSPVNDRLCELGRFGQKTGAGWFRYEAGSREPMPDALVDQIVTHSAREQNITRHVIGAAEILNRCLLPLVNEGARLLAEGISERASDIDLVWINGYGFPAWKGGPMHWADSLGLAKVAADISALGLQHADFRPAPLLLELAAKGGSFGDYDRSRAT